MAKVLKVQAERVKLPVIEIKEYEYNNKIHGEKQITGIAESIKRFSYIEEIVVDKNNVIILGHGRLKAIKKLGYDEIQVKRLLLDSKDTRAFRLIHNKLAQFDVDYLIENISYDIENGVDLSLGTISQDEILLDFEIESLDVSNGQISASSVNDYEDEQEDIDDIDDLLSEMDSVEMPNTGDKVIRGVQVVIPIEDYELIYKEFLKAMRTQTNIGGLLLKELRILELNQKKNENT